MKLHAHGVSSAGRAARRSVAAILILGGSLTGCTTGDDSGGTAVTWVEHDLPPHSGASGRTVLRDAVHCGDRWYIVGAVFLDRPSETRDTRPAAWSSADGDEWTPVKVEADTYWGRRAILNSVACSRDRIAVVGARSGGAHGNPRVTTFRLTNAGVLVDVLAVFTQFGGVSATNVGPISGGEEGWLIAGNRLSGPGVWITDDPHGFTLVEGEAGLTDDGDLESLAQAGAWDGDAWVLVGAGAPDGQMLDRDPLAWTSADGLSWTPETVPAGPESEDVHRAIGLSNGTVLGVGTSGRGFAAWLRDEGGWSGPKTFGAIAEDWVGVPYVASLAETSVGVLATVSDGASYQLWQSKDGSSWRRLEVPVAPDTAGDHTLAVGAGEDLLLLADAGDGGRTWLGESVGGED